MIPRAYYVKSHLYKCHFQLLRFYLDEINGRITLQFGLYVEFGLYVITFSITYFDQAIPFKVVWEIFRNIAAFGVLTVAVQ